MNILSRELSKASRTKIIEYGFDVYSRLKVNQPILVDWEKVDRFRYPDCNPVLWNSQHWRWFMLAYGKQNLATNLDLQLPTVENGKFRMHFSEQSDEAFLFDNRLNHARGLALWKKLQSEGYQLQSGDSDWSDCFGYSWYSNDDKKLLRRTNDARVYISYDPVQKNGSF